MAKVLDVDEYNLEEIALEGTLEEGWDYLILDGSDLVAFRRDNVDQRDSIGDFSEIFIFSEEGAEKCRWILGKDVDLSEIW